MICGHIHELSFDLLGCAKDAQGQPCPVVVGSRPNVKENYYAGAGFVFDKDSIEVVFADKEQVFETNRIDLK